MAGEKAAEFQDWELLVSSDSDVVNSPNSVGKSRNLEEMELEADSEGVIRLDYFSLENDDRFAKNVVDASEEGSVQSDNPSWIDPGPETRYHRANSGDFWSDSGSDRSDERKTNELDVKSELGLVESTKTELGFGGIGEIVASKDKELKLEFEENMKSQMGFEGFGEAPKDKNLAEFWQDSGNDGFVSGDVEKVNEESEIAGESDGGNSSNGENLSAVQVNEMKRGCEEQKKSIVWWKIPIEVFKYCVFGARPIWSFSMAAAVVGLVILGRRLYKMKRKAHSLQLKVTVDDKKVSQVMSRVARLNEAFSVVRRVPIVRPLLPAAGVNPWPVMSLR